MNSQELKNYLSIHSFLIITYRRSRRNARNGEITFFFNESNIVAYTCILRYHIEVIKPFEKFVNLSYLAQLRNKKKAKTASVTTDHYASL